MTSSRTEELVTSYLTEQWAALGSKYALDPTPSPRHARIAQVKVLGTYLHEISKLVGPRPALCKCAPPTAEDLDKPGFFAFAKGFRCKCEL